MSEAEKLEYDFLVPWTVLPKELDPAFGMLNAERALRKRQQISNIVRYVSRMMRDGCRVVDLCGGGGHISLVIAWIFPKVKVTLLDKNEVSLAMAEKRRKEMGLENMEIVCSDVQAWNPSSEDEENQDLGDEQKSSETQKSEKPEKSQNSKNSKKSSFDIGIAIHACGSLSDIIMEKCIENGASYVMAPCCFGALQNADTSLIPLPRSLKFSDAGVTLNDYMSLSSVADINTSGSSISSLQYITGRNAMALIDLDRNLRASQEGYSTFQFTMHPPTCSPKNDIICGLSPSFLSSLPYPSSPSEPSNRSFFDSPLPSNLLINNPSLSS